MGVESQRSWKVPPVWDLCGHFEKGVLALLENDGILLSPVGCLCHVPKDSCAWGKIIHFIIKVTSNICICMQFQVI